MNPSEELLLINAETTTRTVPSDQVVMSFCYTFSLILAYVIASALVITAFYMYREPTLVIVISEASSYPPEERRTIRVVYEE
jgi:hypothetical protein